MGRLKKLENTLYRFYDGDKIQILHAYMIWVAVSSL